MKTITVKSDDNGIVMEWNLEGSGKCEAGTNNPFLENCLKSFAEASFEAHMQQGYWRGGTDGSHGGFIC